MILLSILFFNSVFSQEKEDLFKKDILPLVEEMEFMYGYNQIMREYILYKTFNKSETDSIENLSIDKRNEIIKNRNFVSDGLGKKIYKEYINPMDVAHTQRMIEIIKKYNFPSVQRIRKYYKKDFKDPEFSPVILLIHSPKQFAEELKSLMLKEYKAKNISQCTYGYLLWHFLGRKSLQPMLDNGYRLVEKNGIKTVESTCED
ncbi:hypothetical protein EDM00_11665 [Ornithobacterium rhinotracheale]|uniref:hypothetical protein n=1 Tax=Ornithobacterium rhinotracheale TaxID=28251 RepID=UPI00129C60B9|nr:hypothetical protein [Ornithobacterium rhinotracheale]MRI64637.1 hypothetical protein [Ornithobacterium rhinotracheale]